MIGVNREAQSSAGASLSTFGGGINPGGAVSQGLDPDYIVEFAKAHEDSGFDQVLLGYSSSTADGFAVAGYAAYHTRKLGYLIAHRAGFMSPTLAGRMAATLDQLTSGRIALHVITGGSDLEQQRDGDWLDHEQRYRRTGEYLDILRRVWTEEQPFDYQGEVLSPSAGSQRGAPLAAPSPAYFLRRRIRGRQESGSAPRRRVRSLGRAAGRNKTADRRHSPAGVRI